MIVERRGLAAVVSALIVAGIAAGAEPDDRQLVAALDVGYQAAVTRNDAAAMAKILDDRFVLVRGTGKTHSRDELLTQARNRTVEYELQDEEPGTQTVRVFGDTATVTTLLRVKGTIDGKAIDRRLWFSDTYVRAPQGWRYVFGQASLPLQGQFDQAPAERERNQAERSSVAPNVSDAPMTSSSPRTRLPSRAMNMESRREMRWSASERSMSICASVACA